MYEFLQELFLGVELLLDTGQILLAKLSGKVELVSYLVLIEFRVIPGSQVKEELLLALDPPLEIKILCYLENRVGMRGFVGDKITDYYFLLICPLLNDANPTLSLLQVLHFLLRGLLGLCDLLVGQVLYVYRGLHDYNELYNI